MVNKNFRKAIQAYGEDHDLEIKILDNHAYDKSVVGITEDGRLIYSYEKMVEEFAEDEECSMEEAVEWVEYNTLRAIPYFGEGAPIIAYDSISVILENYGDTEACIS